MNGYGIMAARNNDVNAINNIIQGQILGKYTTYKSIDTIMNMDKIVNYQIEFFNSLDIPGVQHHDCIVTQNWYAHNFSSQHQFTSNVQWN